MSKADKAGEMRDEYDLSTGVRGRYAIRHAQGDNSVVLDPDVAKKFNAFAEVNKAFREFAAKKCAFDLPDSQGESTG